MIAPLAILSAIGFAATAGACPFTLPAPLAAFVGLTSLACAVMMLAARDRRVRVEAEERALRAIMGGRS